jgi:hypothetical protein
VSQLNKDVHKRILLLVGLNLSKTSSCKQFPRNAQTRKLEPYCYPQSVNTTESRTIRQDHISVQLPNVGEPKNMETSTFTSHRYSGHLTQRLRSGIVLENCAQARRSHQRGASAALKQIINNILRGAAYFRESKKCLSPKTHPASPKPPSTHCCSAQRSSVLVQLLCSLQ